jgi:hypothetical protein
LFFGNVAVKNKSKDEVETREIKIPIVTLKSVADKKLLILFES